MVWQYQQVKPRIELCLVLVASAAWAVAAAPPPGAARQHAASSPQRLVVLNIEISGDLGGPDLAAEHAARLGMASARLRAGLERTGLYELVDNAPAQDLIGQLKSQHRYLHDCNGCDLDVGRRLGADQVLVASVYRVSALILTLTYEIHDVATGQITKRKSFDFRGDNDTAWIHAIDYMVRDMKEGAEDPGA